MAEGILLLLPVAFVSVLSYSKRESCLPLCLPPRCSPSTEFIWQRCRIVAIPIPAPAEISLGACPSQQAGFRAGLKRPEALTPLG